MSKRLIINADDFGFNREITDAIVRTHREGVVTSTTLMPNMSAADYACGLAADLPDLSIGVHFTLSQYKPLLPPAEVPSLVGPDGRFLSFDQIGRRAFRFRLNRRELEAELEAQVRYLLDRGVTPTHWDSHHHSGMYPQTFMAAARVAKRMGIRAQRTYRNWIFVDRLAANPRALRRQRRRQARRFLPKRLYYRLTHLLARRGYGMATPDCLHSAGRMVTDVDRDDLPALWRRLLANVPEGTSEVLCHPGCAHGDPEDREAMMQQRLVEFDILTAGATRDVLEGNNITLISYKDL